MRTVLAAIALSGATLLAGCGSPDRDAPATEGRAKLRADGAAARSGGRPATREERLPPGRWRKSPRPAPASGLTPEQREQIEELRSIGYVSGSVAAPAERGVVLHDRERAWGGLNFFVSGHAPEAVLMDMDGNVLHRWHSEFSDSFPGRPFHPDRPDIRFWRRAHLFENGEILAIHEGLGLVKLGRDSRPIWARPLPAHHDLQVLPGGSIVVLTREAGVDPRVDERAPILQDFVSILDPQGVERRRLSLLDAFDAAGAEHDWRAALRTFWRKERTRQLAAHPGDLFHTNSVELLDGRLAARVPAFAAGNLLVSMCHLDTIAVVDLNRERVVWSLGGIFALQHDPTVLRDGRLLVFDNNWRTARSRVVALDPATREIVWEYRGSEERPFYSRTCGTAAELPNGNVLVTESDGGRAFEITPAGETVWEFYNPHRAGENDEYIATLFEVVRLPAGFAAGWLERAHPARPAPPLE